MATQLITLAQLFSCWAEAELRRGTGMPDTESKKKQDIVFKAAIEWASMRFLSYARGKYPGTVFTAANLPGELIDTIGISAAYKILTAAGSVPERLRTRFEDETKYLEQIAAGKVALNVESGEGDNTQTPVSSAVKADRWANRDDMECM